MRAAPQNVRAADPAPARGKREDAALEREADMAADMVVRDRFPDKIPPISPLSGHGTGSLPSAVRTVLAQPGEPLSQAERAYFEPRFGRDLSGILIHRDGGAERSAASLDARAYAHGNHIVFGAGEFAPGSASGRQLMAHELGHALQQQNGMRAIQRKPRREGEEEDKDKPAVVSVTAEQGAMTADVVLSDGTSASVELLVNKLAPGDYTTSPLGRVRNPTAQGIQDKFIYRFPVDPYTQEPLNGLAPKIEIHIRARPAAEIRELPAEIRNFVTSDRAREGTADEYRDAAYAGQILKDAGVTADELILVQESQRHDREMGNVSTEFGGSQSAWALDYVEKRRKKKLDEASNSDALVELSKIMADAPVHLLHRGGVSSILENGSDALARVNYWNLYKFYQIPFAGREDLNRNGARLLGEFRALIGHFEDALIAELTNLAVTALDSAEASLLRMDRQYVGLWQDKKWAPDYFWSEVERINRNEKVAAAARERAAVKQKLESEQRADSISRALNPLGVIGEHLSGEPTYSQRTDQREKQMEQQEQAFNQTVAEQSNLKVTQGFSAQDILSAKDAGDARSRLANFLYDGRQQISRARSLIGDRKIIYAADKIIDMEKERLKGPLGAKSSEINRVIDDLASYRKSQTSLWDDILKVVEFVSMFVPGPIGWGLRLGVAAINLDKKLSDIGKREAIYGGNLTTKSVGSGEVGSALFEAAIQVIDVPPVAKAERLTLNLERGAVRSADETAGIASRTASTAEHGAPQGVAGDVAGGAKLPEPPAGGSSAHASPPTKPDLGMPTYNNLPDRAAKGGERVRIVEKDGKYFELDHETGALTPAAGEYSFARMPDGSLWGSRYGHAEASMGKRVGYAGQVRFEDGVPKRWSGESGTYRPVGGEHAKQAGFPIPPDPIPPHPGKKVQLPVFQERTKPRPPTVDPDATVKPHWTDRLPEAKQRTAARRAEHGGDVLAAGTTRGGLPPDVDSALGKLGVSEAEVGKFLKGEKAAGVIKRGDIEFKHYLINEGDTFVAGVLSSYAHGDRASMIKAYLTFRQTSLGMAKSMGAKTLRLEADVVMDAGLAEELMRRGYTLVDPYSSKYALEIPL